MKPLVELFGVRHRLALFAGAIAFALLLTLAVVARARATETMYWDNWSDSPVTVGTANVDGSGGGLVNLGNVAYSDSEGVTYDPVTGRLYVAAETFSEPRVGSIYYVNLDGSGGGVFTAPGISVEEPQGIAIDPATRMMYWANTESGTIGWAKLDGSAAGRLNTSGAVTNGMGRLALDPVGGRVFWTARSGGADIISYANVNGTGGGVFAGTLGVVDAIHGLATDPVDGRLYLLGKGEEKEGVLASIPLTGGPLTEIPLGNTAYKSANGVAIDPLLQKAYWGNFGLGTGKPGAIGFTGLGGGPGTISPATHTNGAQDPVILKSPTGAGGPQVSQNGTALSCSQGSWSLDYPGANVFAAPSSFTYQWSLNGQAISGATASTLAATTAGSYGCTVTGKNAVGSASQTSTSSVSVTPTSLSAALLTKKAHVKAGKPVLVKLRFANGGDIASAPVTVCASLTRKAKKGLIPPKCASVGSLGFGASATATLRVKTKKSARDVYKFTTQVKGATVAPVTVSIKVTPAKKHKKKHHKKL